MQRQYKVCILAAGKGSRLSTWRSIHKALLPIGNVAIISRIIHEFPVDVEIVVAVGYQATQIKNFIRLAHPERSITFVDVDRWEGEGSGPGYSLLSCQESLQCPFIFTSVDTLVAESIPEPKQNWIGVAAASDTQVFLMAEVEAGRVKRFHDKIASATLRHRGYDLERILPYAFIGIAGVHDWQLFWHALTHNRGTLVQGELQVANGLQGLLGKLSALSFTWHDTGSDVSYHNTARIFPEIVAPKKDEQFYMQGGRVIKFFADEEITTRRVARAQALVGLVPPVIGRAGQFFSYKKAAGKLLSEVHDVSTFEDFLEFCALKLWRPQALTPKSFQDFTFRCDQFYRAKTEERVNQFHTLTTTQDQSHRINGMLVPPLQELLSQIPWDTLAHGTPTLIHGDLQPENILIDPNGNFVFLDWRQDFAGLLEYGDMYYDLAKMDHALLINGEIIRRNHFNIKIDGQEVLLEFYIRSHLAEYRQLLDQFMRKNGYNVPKVRILTGLIYLNIAPLHENPYNELVYYLGKYLLYATLNESNGTFAALRDRKTKSVARIPTS